MILRVYAEALLVLSDADATCVCKVFEAFWPQPTPTLIDMWNSDNKPHVLSSRHIAHSWMTCLTSRFEILD